MRVSFTDIPFLTGRCSGTGRDNRNCNRRKPTPNQFLGSLGDNECHHR